MQGFVVRLASLSISCSAGSQQWTQESFFEPQSPHLSNKGNNTSFAGFFWGWNIVRFWDCNTAWQVSGTLSSPGICLPRCHKEGTKSMDSDSPCPLGGVTAGCLVLWPPSPSPSPSRCCSGLVLLCLCCCCCCYLGQWRGRIQSQSHTVFSSQEERAGF